MELTEEQQEIIRSTGDIKINAVAGSGKTTTIIEYASSKPSASKILYLAFNKSVKLEASRKFSERNLFNVKVETAHSLAYRHVVFKHGYKVKAQGYKTNEIAELLNLKGNGEKHTEYVIANHVNKFITYFCNSDKQKLSDLNYLDTISDKKARSFVTSFYDYIVAQSRLLLSKMDKGEIEITHDFYLKKFQLSKPVLDYDFILFDEGQDASAAMLDVFLKQKATKIIVGDRHQQIYGWRYAVNSLEKVNFPNYDLSTSFRFSQDIANLAREILTLKKHIDGHGLVAINGTGSSCESKMKAILARTNLGLLLRAIEYITENNKVKRIYFEGNIHSYTYADEGASLYDVLNLYNYDHRLIKDKLIQSMRDMDELEDYIDKTEDAQLGMMVEIVKEYGNEIPGIIRTLKEKHVGNEEKGKAEVIFSTVHRCKGMEYDDVELVNDFITEEKLGKVKEDKNEEKKDLAKLNEEINLLYVAVTRTKNILRIPESMMPAAFPPSKQIYAVKVTEKSPKKQDISAAALSRAYRKKSIGHKDYVFRDQYKAAYQPWTPDQDKQLTDMFQEGIQLSVIAKHFGRTKGSIISRVKRLEIEF